jgi:hypothetical protein
MVEWKKTNEMGLALEQQDSNRKGNANMKTNNRQ